MGLNRYYVPDLADDGIVALPEDEAHHAVRVRRESVGNRCVVFDGQGKVADAVFREIEKRKASVEVRSIKNSPRDLPGEVLLGVSMPKGDRQKDVVEKACELGIHRLVPIVSERSVSMPDSGSSLKWQRYVIEACKQCERNRLMQIDSPISFREWLELHSKTSDETNDEALGNRQSSLRLIAHPNHGNEDDIDSVLRMLSIQNASASSIRIAIGPEGGFVGHEVQLAVESGWQTLALGERILRVETAVCAAGVLAGMWIKRKKP